MKNNTQEFNMEKYNEFLSKIKAGSPVHKINFTMASPNAIAGMYLIVKNDAKTYLDKMVDRSDLNSDTLLVFESRHVIECCQIIYGCLELFNNLNILKFSYNEIINNIIEAVLTKPLFYPDMVKEMDAIVDSCIKTDMVNMTEYGIKTLGLFKYIMNNIWFVPYGEIDKLSKEAIEDFKNGNVKANE